MTQFSSLIYQTSHSNKVFWSKTCISYKPYSQNMASAVLGQGKGGTTHYYVLDPLEDIKNKSNPPEKLVKDNIVDDGITF